MSASDAPQFLTFDASQELDRHRGLKVDNHKVGMGSLSWGTLESGPDCRGSADAFRSAMRDHWTSVFEKEIGPALYLQLCKYLHQLQGERTMLTFGNDIHSLKDKDVAAELFVKSYQARVRSALTDMMSRAQPKSAPYLELDVGKQLIVTLEYEKCYAPPTLEKDLVCLQFVLQLLGVLLVPGHQGIKGNIKMVCGIYIWKDKPPGIPIPPGTAFSADSSSFSFITDPNDLNSFKSSSPLSSPPSCNSGPSAADHDSSSEWSGAMTPTSSQGAPGGWYRSLGRKN
jgi:hypothetical protein